MHQLIYGKAEVAAYEKLIAADGEDEVEPPVKLGATGKAGGESIDDEDEAAAHADLGLVAP